MDRKEGIMLAALKLAAEKGSGSVSMQQIADAVGIKKPSLYNHFKSKEELFSAMYEHFRSKSRMKSAAQTPTDPGELMKNNTPEQLLTGAVMGYMSMSSRDPELLMFYKMLYAQRTSDPTAAGILIEETRRMIAATKNLFYAMQVHGKLNFRDIDRSAESFALNVHAIMDMQMDIETAGFEPDPEMLSGYIHWFIDNMGGTAK